MKKNVYLTILVIITVICVIGGTCYHVIGFGLSFMDKLDLPIFSSSQKSSAGKVVDSEVISLDDFTTLEADVSIMDLTVQSGESFSLKYSGNQKLIPSYEVKDGTLTLKQTGNYSNIWGNKKCSVTITIPDKLTLVNIASDVGDIDLDNIEIDTLYLSADVGDIDITGCILAIAEVTADVGDIDLERCSFNELNVSNDVGDVDVDSSVSLSTFYMDLKTDIGEVEINDQNQRKSYTQNGSGDGKLTIQNSTGDIEVTY